MNLKNIRKNYDSLTKLERLALADNAIARDDQSEIEALIAASPRESYTAVDYYDLLREITTFRLCNLIVRFSYMMQFDFFHRCEIESIKKKKSDEVIENNAECAQMSAFLYCRAKDAWQIVNDELGLRPNFDEEISEFLFSYDLLSQKEKVMRAFAFTYDEATEFVKKTYKDDCRIKTVEDEVRSIREMLELES